MTTILESTTKHRGIGDDYACVTASWTGAVIVRAVDPFNKEAATIAISPDQARALAAAIVVAANDAEAET